MIPKGWNKKEWENLKKDYPNNYMKAYEIKDRIDAYVQETYRCWIDQEASMKQVDLKSMFEQILEDGKQLGNNKIIK
tara:strand:- start:85 stop:315 length:231 start_codon:yes stop_codon:yes gene_type:complete